MEATTTPENHQADIAHIIHTSVDDARSSAAHATPDQLERAIAWCKERAGHKSREAMLQAALRKRRLAEDTASHMPPVPAGKTAYTLPSDEELLKTAHLNDVERIASMASRADIIAAIRWIDAGQLPAEAKRRVLLSEALRKKGGSK